MDGGGGGSLAAFHSLPLPPATDTSAAANEPAAAAHTTAALSCACTTQHALAGTGGTSGCCSASGTTSSTPSCTAWVARDGIVYSTSAGTVDMRRKEAEEGRQQEQEQLAQRQHLLLRQLFPRVGAALLGSNWKAVQQSPGADRISAAAGADAAAAGGGSASACHRCRAWQPFVDFVRRQRRHAAKVHRKEGSLPPQLLAQVDAYLPADPAVLVGCLCLSASRGSSKSAAAGAASADGPCCGSSGGGTCACAGGGMPAWVHGDLTAGNMLLGGGLLAEQGCTSPLDAQQQQQQGWQGQGAGQPGEPPPPPHGSSLPAGSAQAAAAVLIDFADSGQGDPLWDFVVLLLRTLR